MSEELLDLVQKTLDELPDDDSKQRVLDAICLSMFSMQRKRNETT